MLKLLSLAKCRLFGHDFRSTLTEPAGLWCIDCGHRHTAHPPAARPYSRRDQVANGMRLVLVATAVTGLAASQTAATMGLVR